MCYLDGQTFLIYNELVQMRKKSKQKLETKIVTNRESVYLKEVLGFIYKVAYIMIKNTFYSPTNKE